VNVDRKSRKPVPISDETRTVLRRLSSLSMVQ
jgi:hypothetical protein